MKYTTSDYLKDSFWLFSFLANFWPKYKHRILRFFERVIEIDYHIYIARIIENVPYAFLIVYLGLIGIFTLAKYTERSNGVRVATITTNSMNPSITSGTLIVSKPNKIYKVTDIIAYKEINPSTKTETGRIITHRIVEVKSDGFVTKGDANEFPDPGEVKREQVLGSVFLVVPNLGFLDIIVRTIPGFLIFVALPTFIIVRSELKFLRETRGSKN